MGSVPQGTRILHIGFWANMSTIQLAIAVRNRLVRSLQRRGCISHSLRSPNTGVQNFEILMLLELLLIMR